MSRSFGGTSLTTLPPIEMSPRVMFSSPAIIRSKVDLPQPEGPTRITNSPSAMSTETPCSTSVVPNALRTFAIVTVAILGVVASPGAARSPTRARAGLPLSELGDARLLGGDEFEQRRLARLGLLDAALDRRLDLAGIGDALAIAAERPRHRRVVAGDVGRAVFLRGDRHHLELDRHREIVKQDRQDGDALAHRGLEIHPREADRRVAPQVDAELFRLRELGAHREAEPHAELRRLAPADIAHRLGRHPERRDLVARAAGVMRDDGVLRIDRVHQLPDDAVGIEWRLIVVE